MNNNNSTNSLEEFLIVLREHEIKTFSKFVCIKSEKAFTEAKFTPNKNMKIHWYGAVPHFHIGRRVYACHQGKDTNLSNKKKFAEKRDSEASKDPDFTKRRKKAPPTKKLNCPVVINVSRVLALPRFEVSKLAHYEKNKMSEAIKEKLVKGEDIFGEYLYSFNLPDETSHQNHIVGVTAEVTENIDPKVRSKRLKVSNAGKKRMSFKKWIPEKILNGEGSFALIILNQPLNEENTLFLRQHWNSAVVRVAIDGGANYLRNILKNDMLMPHFISGDFDSVTPENIEFFKEKGVNIIHTPDQDHTDFTKGLKLTLEFLKEHNVKISSIIAVVRNEDRLDHLFGNLNTLYFALEWTHIPVFLLGNKCLTWALTKGSHKIKVPRKMKSSNVGLIPLGKECTDISTTGLKWNLTHGNLKFGGLISTSNTWDDNATEVVITTDTELIFTMEIKVSC